MYIATAGLQFFQHDTELDLQNVALTPAEHWQARTCVPAVVTKGRVRKVPMRTLVTAAGTHDTCSTCKVGGTCKQVGIMPLVCSTCLYVPFSNAQRGKVACHAALWQQLLARCAVFRIRRISMYEDLLIQFAMLQHETQP